MIEPNPSTPHGATLCYVLFVHGDYSRELPPGLVCASVSPELYVTADHKLAMQFDTGAEARTYAERFASSGRKMSVDRLVWNRERGKAEYPKELPEAIVWA